MQLHVGRHFVRSSLNLFPSRAEITLTQFRLMLLKLGSGDRAGCSRLKGREHESGRACSWFITHLPVLNAAVSANCLNGFTVFGNSLFIKELARLS
jgi:hypothetical protein